MSRSVATTSMPSTMSPSHGNHLNHVPITNQPPPALNKLLLHSCCKALAHHPAQLGYVAGVFWNVLYHKRGKCCQIFVDYYVYIVLIKVFTIPRVRFPPALLLPSPSQPSLPLPLPLMLNFAFDAEAAFNVGCRLLFPNAFSMQIALYIHDSNW